MNEYKPQTVTSPGVTLLEKLEELEIGPKEFAVRTDKPEKTITAVLNGESSITPDMAVQFERVLQIPAKFWLQRQILYDEYLAREKQELHIKDAVSWMKNFPVKEMIKNNWLPNAKSEAEKAEALLSYFGIASHRGWGNYYLEQKLKVAFRISLSNTKEPEAISAWLRRGEMLSKSLSAPDYDKKVFEEILSDLKKIMAKHPDDFFAQIQNKSLEAGVKVVFTPCLPKAPINGATRWINDTPVIQLSGRYKRNDSFWFTLFHEAGHIIKHGKKDIFLENIDYSDKDLEKEKEADEFAVEWTLTHDEYEEIIKEDELTIEMLLDFAEKFTTHPAIIIGRLQHEGKIPYSVGRQFFQTIELN
jgi:addiction module HigA family antidote